MSIYSLMVVTQDRQYLKKRGKTGSFKMKKCPSPSFFSLLLFFLLLAMGFPGYEPASTERQYSSSHPGVLRASVEPFKTGTDTVKEIPPSYPFMLYNVDQKDTISLVAARFSLNPSTLISLNRLSHPGEIKEGMKIYIPGEDGTRRPMPEDQTLSAWAQFYSLEESELIPLGEGDYFLPRTSLDSKELSLFWKNYFSYPVAAVISGYYGESYDEKTGLSKKREGLEFRAPLGYEVKSVRGGVVAKAGFHGTFGWYMVLNHPGDFQSLYAHLDSFDKEEGDKVERGETIAQAGNSGHSSGNMLYFSLFKSGETVDPLVYLY